MSLILSPSSITVGSKVPFPFGATGGVLPYTFSVVPGGAGGTIDPVSGLYTAPQNAFGIDSILVTDSTLITPLTATAVANVVTPYQLVCGIIQDGLSLSNGRVWVWDQKIPMPTDSALFAVLSVLSCKPFSNQIYYDGSGGGLNSVQSTNFFANIQIDIMSSGLDALNRKEEVIMALNSSYSQSQQELNSFKLASIPSSFNNLSSLDGSKIPYRFAITLGLQWMVSKTVAVPYFDTFSVPTVTTEQ